MKNFNNDKNDLSKIGTLGYCLKTLIFPRKQINSENFLRLDKGARFYLIWISDLILIITMPLPQIKDAVLTPNPITRTLLLILLFATGGLLMCAAELMFLKYRGFIVKLVFNKFLRCSIDDIKVEKLLIPYSCLMYMVMALEELVGCFISINTGVIRLSATFVSCIYFAISLKYRTDILFSKILLGTSIFYIIINLLAGILLLLR